MTVEAKKERQRSNMETRKRKVTKEKETIFIFTVRFALDKARKLFDVEGFVKG